MDVAVLEGLRSLRLRKRRITAPKEDEVQLQINCVGICGSDMAYWSKGVAGGFVQLDFSEEGLNQGYCGQMGHECSGTVRSVGAKVTHLQVGDRVALEPGVPCSDCKLCRSGRYNLCPKMRFIGSAVNRVPGALCRKFNHKASYCYKLPPSVSLQEGAMLEPLCVSLQAVTRAKVGVGHHVFVSGAGPIGLMTAMCAKAAGAATVTITDMVDAKLEKAKEIGADYTLKADMPDLLSALESCIGEKFDMSFECCGVPAALNSCIQATMPGGVVCVVANLPQSIPLDLQVAVRHEVDIIGVYRYCNLYPRALALVSSGKINLKPLISKTFQLEEAQAAFEHFASGEPIKVIIQPSAPEQLV
ncbi:Sorbitol dehydrogenase (SDH) (Polyol dehydrogenase) [Durusdinium trenchii]